MATCKFYLHKGQWFYKRRPGFDAGKPVDAFALDKILGVTGAREVVVMLPSSHTGRKYGVHIDNGFILAAELESEKGAAEIVTEFVVRELPEH